MEKTEVLDLSKEIILTTGNAEQVAQALLKMLKGRRFAVVTHVAYPGMRMEVESSQTLAKANGKQPVSVEHNNGSTKIIVLSSSGAHIFPTRLTEEVPDYEHKHAHFIFSMDQVRIVFRNLKEEKIYLIFALEKHEAKET